jgi:3-oxoacyl-[acyl-carrier protein] reductase
MTDTSRRAALVTGSASGIGKAAALRLAAAGYDVAINYSRSADRAKETFDELNALGGSHLALQADVSDEDAVRGMVSQVSAAYGRLDALVNNAGTTSETPPDDLDGVSLDEWDRVFAVNVRGLFQVTRAAAPLLRAAGGSVVNVASIVGLRPGPQPLAYAASKAAVVSLTRTLSRVLAPEVRVNAVAPGWIAGEWMERTLGDNYERLMARRAQWTPMQRNVTLEDVAESILSLLESNPFVTGETIVIDGGYTATSLVPASEPSVDEFEAGGEQRTVRGDRVPLVGVLGGLPRADRAPEAVERLLRGQRFEDDERVGVRGLLRLAHQPGGVTDPDVLDLSAA